LPGGKPGNAHQPMEKDAVSRNAPDALLKNGPPRRGPLGPLLGPVELLKKLVATHWVVLDVIVEQDIISSTAIKAAVAGRTSSQTVRRRVTRPYK